MDDEAFNFAIKHLVPNMRKLEELREQALDTLHEKIVQKLQTNLPDCKPVYECSTNRNWWPEGPALRYSHDGWWIGNSISEVALYLCIQKGCLYPLVQVYLVHMTSDLEKRAHKQFGQDGKQQPGDVLRFEWSFDEFDEQTVVEAFVEKMKIAMQFEDLRGGGHDER